MNFDTKYTSKVSYPRIAEYKRYFVYRKGEVIFKGTAQEFNKQKLDKSGVVEEVLDEEKYREAIRLYHKDQERLNEEFQTELFALHGVTGNPKAQTCYGIAYERGHSGGYGEVASVFAELVELIK